MFHSFQCTTSFPGITLRMRVCIIHRGTARAHLGTYFGFGNKVQWLSNVNCRGDERHLALCPATTGRAASCWTNQQAGVTCDVDRIGEPRCELTSAIMCFFCLFVLRAKNDLS